jgi:hypothetical protein
MTVESIVGDMARAAKAASREMARCPTPRKNAMLLKLTDLIQENAVIIQIIAGQQDLGDLVSIPLKSVFIFHDETGLAHCRDGLAFGDFIGPFAKADFAEACRHGAGCHQNDFQTPVNQPAYLTADGPDNVQGQTAILGEHIAAHLDNHSFGIVKTRFPVGFHRLHPES